MVGGFPGSPRVARGALVLMDPDGRSVRRVVPLQYNPDALTRTLQPQGVGADAGDRLEALRLRGAAVETIKLEAELDATDRLEFPDGNPATARHGLHPELAALENTLSPAAADLASSRALAATGSLEIVPVMAPLVLFVWGEARVVPVRITEFTVLEDAFDPALNPIRAKVSLSLRVLSVDDLDPQSRGAGLFLAYLRRKEQMAGRARSADLRALGVGALP